MGEPDADFDKLLAEQGELMEKIEHAEGWELDSRIEQAMDALRCPPGDEPVTHLSGGERRRVALCKLLLEAARPAAARRADEPPRRRERAVARAAPGALPGHDPRRHARPVLPRQRGRVDPRTRPRPRLPVRGQLLDLPGEEGRAALVQGKKDQKLERRLRDELDWVRQNASGRQAKSKARLQRYEEMAAEAEKTRKLDFEEIQIPPGPRLGNVVVEASHLDKGFDGELLMKDLSFTLPRGGIVGVIGPNGVGKTTLFRMIVGEEKPDAGELRIGETVKLSYVDQSRGGLDPKKTVFQVVSDGLDYINVGHVEMPSRAYVSAFGFKGPDQQKPAGVLSGGERNRLNLALTLKEGGNVLLLDEPTNDLDVETLGSLENALLELPGLRRDHQPRPVVPRPDRDAHPGVGGRRRQRREVVLVRGQLRLLREEQDRAARHRGGPSARRDAPQAHPGLMPERTTRRSSRTTPGCSMSATATSVYWEVCGNPAGKPAVFLHGGPGGGCSAEPPAHVRSRPLPGRALRPAQLRPQPAARRRPRHRPDRQHDRPSDRRHRAAARAPRRRSLAGLGRFVGCDPRASPTPSGIRTGSASWCSSRSPIPRAAEIDWLYGGVGPLLPGGVGALPRASSAPPPTRPAPNS